MGHDDELFDLSLEIVLQYSDCASAGTCHEAPNMSDCDESDRVIGLGTGDCFSAGPSGGASWDVMPCRMRRPGIQRVR